MKEKLNNIETSDLIQKVQEFVSKMNERISNPNGLDASSRNMCAQQIIDYRQQLSSSIETQILANNVEAVKSLFDSIDLIGALDVTLMSGKAAVQKDDLAKAISQSEDSVDKSSYDISLLNTETIFTEAPPKGQHSDVISPPISKMDNENSKILMEYQPVNININPYEHSEYITVVHKVQSRGKEQSKIEENKNKEEVQTTQNNNGTPDKIKTYRCDESNISKISTLFEFTNSPESYATPLESISSDKIKCTQSSALKLKDTLVGTSAQDNKQLANQVSILNEDLLECKMYIQQYGALIQQHSNEIQHYKELNNSLSNKQNNIEQRMKQLDEQNTIMIEESKQYKAQMESLKSIITKQDQQIKVLVQTISTYNAATTAQEHRKHTQCITASMQASIPIKEMHQIDMQMQAPAKKEESNTTANSNSNAPQSNDQATKLITQSILAATDPLDLMLSGEVPAPKINSSTADINKNQSINENNTPKKELSKSTLNENTSIAQITPKPINYNTAETTNKVVISQNMYNSSSGEITNQAHSQLEERYRACLGSNKGVLYADKQLQLGFIKQIAPTQINFELYFGNVSADAITIASLQIDEAVSNALEINIGSVPSILEIKKQYKTAIKITVKEPFTGNIILLLEYKYQFNIE